MVYLKIMGNPYYLFYNINVVCWLMTIIDIYNVNEGEWKNERWKKIARVGIWFYMSIY